MAGQTNGGARQVRGGAKQVETNWNRQRGGTQAQTRSEPGDAGRAPGEGVVRVGQTPCVRDR